MDIDVSLWTDPGRNLPGSDFLFAGHCDRDNWLSGISRCGLYFVGSFRLGRRRPRDT